MKQYCKLPVFVYGSLKKGFGLHKYIANEDFLGFGTVGGSIFSLGAFPGFVSTKEGKVQGEVYRITKEVIATLDNVEGEGVMYSRRVKQASLDGGGTLPVWIYEYLNPPANWESKKVENGNWLR